MRVYEEENAFNAPLLFEKSFTSVVVPDGPAGAVAGGIPYMLELTLQLLD